MIRQVTHRLGISIIAVVFALQDSLALANQEGVAVNSSQEELNEFFSQPQHEVLIARRNSRRSRTSRGRRSRDGDSGERSSRSSRTIEESYYIVAEVGYSLPMYSGADAATIDKLKA